MKRNEWFRILFVAVEAFMIMGMSSLAFAHFKTGEIFHGCLDLICVLVWIVLYIDTLRN